MSTTAPHTGNPGALKMARFLGWFSLALGTPQLVRPDAVSRAIGLKDDRTSRRWQRIAGVRELAAGGGLLGKPHPVEFSWARLAGDVMDLALLTAAFRDKPESPARLTGATAAVVGITAVDLYAALTSSRGRRVKAKEELPTDVRAAITVGERLSQVFAAWENFENFPQFMNHLESVQDLGNRRSRWKARAVGPTTVEWEAEVITLTPNEVIEWRSVGGFGVENSGVVRFKPAPGHHGTEIHVHMEYAPPGGKLGEAVAKLLQDDPTRKVKDDLRRFKQLMETGEIARSESTPEGTAARGLFKQRPAQPLSEEAAAAEGRTS